MPKYFQTKHFSLPYCLYQENLLKKIMMFKLSKIKRASMHPFPSFEKWCCNMRRKIQVVALMNTGRLHRNMIINFWQKYHRLGQPYKARQEGE